MTSTFKDPRQCLILGLGNILLGDEGLGIRAVEALEKRYKLPPHLSLMDGGTAGYALIDYLKGLKKVIIIDAVKGGMEPGTIYRLSRKDLLEGKKLGLSGHQVDLQDVLALAEKLNMLPEVSLIGIEPENMDYNLELSHKIKGALEVAIREVAKEAGILNGMPQKEQ